VIRAEVVVLNPVLKHVIDGGEHGGGDGGDGLLGAAVIVGNSIRLVSGVELGDALG
jgi:hypothetical protein